VQYEDDLNTLPLSSYFTMDAQVSHDLGHGVALFAAGENLLNRRYDIGRTPVRTIAQPLQIRAGVRFWLGQR
jgi:hypothetical protein